MGGEPAGSTRRRFLQASGAAAAAAWLGSCGGSGSESPATGGPAAGTEIGELRLLVPVVPPFLDPRAASVVALGTVLPAIEPLIVLDDRLRAVANLATVRVDGARLRCRLRGDVRFWDGSRLTTADVIHSLSLHTRRGSPSAIADQWRGVRSVRRSGTGEVTITLAGSDPQFIYTLAQSAIVSKAFGDRHGDDAVGTPRVGNMGTGAYRFGAFSPYKRLELLRNERYWGERPPIGRIECRVATDDAARVLALRSGAADGMLGLPPTQARSIRRIDGVRVGGPVDPAVYKFNLDFRTEPWDDPDLRRAFAHCIDRSALVGLLGGEAQPATSIVARHQLRELLPAPAADALYADLDRLTPPFDVAAARRSMARSSVPRGVKAEVLVTGSDPTLAALTQTAGQELERAGIELRVKEVEDAAYFERTYFTHEHDGVSIDSFAMDRPDPSNIPISALYGPNSLPGGSGVNIADYRDAEVDRLLDRQRALASGDPRRGPLLARALKRSARDLAYAPLVHPRILLVLDRELEFDRFDAFWWLAVA